MTDYLRLRRIEGLMAHPDRETRERMERAYHDNPNFYHVVNTLEGAIPIFMESVLKSSEQQRVLLEQMIRAGNVSAQPTLETWSSE